MPEVFLGLGSNMGDRERLLRQAIDLLKERVGEVVSLSAFYETEPWGFVSAHTFLNAAALVQTPLSPEEVLRATRLIERELGRTGKSTGGSYTDRPIDIDLLLYGNLVLEEDFPDDEGCFHLSLPHPLMQERQFVMEPLAEIAPETVHPVLHRTFKALSDALKQK